MNSVETDFPRYVGIETINTCNARCPFCPLFQGSAKISRTSRPAHIMRSEVFADIIAQLSAWARPPASIFLNMNGEPLQDPDFIERCKVLRSYGLGSRIELQTNAQFLGLSEAEIILDAKIGRLVIGFDGASRSVYEYHRARCNYERVIGNIRSFVELRRARSKSTRISVQYVRTRRNVHEIADAWRMFNSMLDPGLDCFQDDVSKDWGDAPGEDQLYFIPKLSTPLERADCQLAAQQLIINSDGKVQACCWDYNLSVSEGGLGDATSQRLIDIWHSRKRREILARINADDFRTRPEKCRTCAYNGPTPDLPSVDGSIPPEYLLSSTRHGHIYRFASMSSAQDINLSAE